MDALIILMSILTLIHQIMQNLKIKLLIILITYQRSYKILSIPGIININLEKCHFKVKQLITYHFNLIKYNQLGVVVECVGIDAIVSMFILDQVNLVEKVIINKHINHIKLMLETIVQFLIYHNTLENVLQVKHM
jgi:hypothetical protein